MLKNEEEKRKVSFSPLTLALNAPLDGQPHLLGSQCASCGKFFFPQLTLCTECFTEGSLKEYPLSVKGKLYSFTIVERESLAPKGFTVPYAYGYVDLPEGVRVLAKIVDWTPQTLQIGAEVVMVVEEIRKNSEGEQIMGFRFKLS